MERNKYTEFFEDLINQMRSGLGTLEMRDKVRAKLKEWDAEGCFSKVVYALLIHEDASLAQYHVEYHLELGKWRAGLPFPVWSELDDTVGCVYVAVHKDGRILGVTKNLYTIGQLVDENSKDADEKRGWSILTFRMV